MKSIEYNNQTFPVILRQEQDGGYFVSNPTFEGCYSQGDTIEEALANITEATQMCMEEADESQEKSLFKDIGIHLINIKHA